MVAGHRLLEPLHSVCEFLLNRVELADAIWRVLGERERLVNRIVRPSLHPAIRPIVLYSGSRMTGVSDRQQIP